MDCRDCHNRVGHRFEAPARTVNRALANGNLAPLPAIKRHAVEVMSIDYPDLDTARREIAARTAPDPHLVSPASKTLRRLQHLHDGPGGEPIFVDQMQQSECFTHGESIGSAEVFGQSAWSL